MGMAALALTTPRTEGVAWMTYDDWMRVPSPWRVVSAAATDERARDAAVSRIIDTMLELQLETRHQNPGYQPFSVTAMFGEASGGGGRADQAMVAALKYHPESEWHKACGWLLDQLPARQAAAMLLQAARCRPGKMGNTQWSVTARQMVERQPELLRSLGLSLAHPFESVEALQVAARRARTKMREWLKDEQLLPVA